MLAFHAARHDSKIFGRVNHCFFQLFDVPASVAAMLCQIKDRVADNLPGTMIGDIAAAVGRMKFHLHLRKQAIVSAQVFAFAVPPEGDHVRVLAEKQNVGNCIRFARFDEFAL
jgi:hypothetical protein